MVRYLTAALFLSFLRILLPAQSFDTLQNIRIEVVFSAAPSTWSVEKAPLRFNKTFAYSFQMDDGANDIWTHGYPYFSGGIIGGVSYPGLKYTDGCGNDHTFKMSSALYSFNSTGPSAVDVHDPSSAYATVNVTWPQLVTMCQHGWGISNHGLSPGNAGNYHYEIARNHSYVKLKTLEATPGGLDMGIFVNPNGDQAYTQPAFGLGYLVCYRDGYSFGQPSFNVNGAWPHQNIMMGRTNTWNAINLSGLVDALASASTGGENHWAVHFTHSVNNATWGYDFNTFKTHMNYIAGKYGKAGFDNIWMATEEEVLDYLLVRDRITLQTALTGNTLHISFTGNLPDTFRFYNATVLISADVPIASISAEGVSAQSSAGTGLDSGMVNISWNGKRILPPGETAEYWVSRAEQTQLQDDAYIAMDYVLMVPEGPAQHAFRVRLCSIPGITMPFEFCTMRNAPNSTVPKVPGCPSADLTVPVMVNGFSDITKVQLRLDYDPAVMTYISGVAARPQVTAGMQFSDEEAGGGSPLRKTVISWSSATPATLSGNDTLALLTYHFMADSTLVQFKPRESGVATCRYEDESGRPMYDMPVPDFYHDGEVSDATLPAPGIISGPDSVCAGSQNLLFRIDTVRGAQAYSWILPEGYSVVSGENSDSIVLSLSAAAASGEIRVRAVNACAGNPLSPAKYLYLKPPPVPVVGGLQALCNGSEGVIYTTDEGMSGYNWVVSLGGTITEGSATHSVKVAWHNAGSQFVGAAFTVPGGCSSVEPTLLPVSIHPYPVPVISGPMEVCIGQTGGIFTTENGMTGYLWSVETGGQILGGQGTPSVTVLWTDTGYHQLGVKYTDLNGCTNPLPALRTIRVNPLPQPVITGSYALCNGRTGVVYNTQTGMTGYAWTVSPGGNITGGTGTNSIMVDWTQSGVQNISVNYTNSNGCTALSPASYPVQVFPLPVPVVTGPVSVCQGIPGMVYATQQGMSDYLWSVSPGGMILSGAGFHAITVRWDVAGDGVVSVTYTDPNGCKPVAPSQLAVVVHSLPDPTVGGPDTVCSGDDPVYVTESGMSGYQWNISGGGTITGGQGTNQIQVSWNQPGGQFISVTYNNSSGCSPIAPVIYPVTVKPLPVPSVTGPSAICNLTAGAIYHTEPGMENYLWSVSSGGTITGGAGTDSVYISWNVSGNQWIAVTYQHTNGCVAASPTVMPVLVRSLPDPVITGPAVLCQGASAVMYSTQPGNSNYLWNISPGGQIMAGAGTNQILVDWLSAGQQSLSVNFTDLFGCTAQVPSTRTITIHPLPIPSVTGDDSLCAGDQTVYSTEPGMLSYLWTVSAGGVITSGAGTHLIHVQWNQPGLQLVTVNYANQEGCFAMNPAFRNVTVFPLPTPAIAGPANLCEGTTGVIYMTETGMNNYLWSLSSGGSITSGQGTSAVVVSWAASGVHSLAVTYTSPSGCSPPIPAQYPVTVNPLPVVSVSGAPSCCINAGAQIYSTQPGQSLYQWLVSAGGVITGGQGTSNIQVNWTSAGSQWTACTYNSPEGCPAAAPDTLFVTVEPLPGLPGMISGPTHICKPLSMVLYSVEPIPEAISYVWTLPPGAGFYGSSNTNMVYVNYLTGAQYGNITVQGTNFCGAGPISALSVTVSPVPPAPLVTQPWPGTLQSDAPEGNQWYRDNLVIPGAISQVYHPESNGLYHTVVTLNGCSSGASNKIQVVFTGVDDIPGLEVQIIPNPNRGSFNILLNFPSRERVVLRIVSMNGAALWRREMITGPGVSEVPAEIRPAVPGNYLLMMETASGRMIRPLVVQ